MRLRILLFIAVISTALVASTSAQCPPSVACQMDSQSSSVWSGSAWINQDLTAMAGSSALKPLESGPTNSSFVQVIYLGADEHIHLLVWNGSLWIDQDLTTLADDSSILATSAN